MGGLSYEQYFTLIVVVHHITKHNTHTLVSMVILSPVAHLKKT